MQFDVDISKDVHVIGDANRLIQIFTNLINNAISYSKEGKTVSLRISTSDAYGIVEVNDQGIGIEKVKYHVCLNVFIALIEHVAVTQVEPGLGYRL